MATLLRAIRKASLASRAAAAAARRAAAAAARRAAAMESRSARAAAVAATAASLASRAAAAAARRAAAMESRSARAAAVAATAACPHKICLCRGDVSTELPRGFPTYADYAQMPDDAKTPTDKDLQSDEATCALYERWCKAFRKQRDPDERDPDEMARRFKIFKYNARMVHDWNSDVPEDPEEAAIFLQKREEAKLLLSKGEDVSRFDDGIVPYQLGPLCDGGDPCLRECDYELLKIIENRESAIKDVIIQVFGREIPELIEMI